MRDVQLSASQMITFPITTGITSQAFKSQKVKYFNDFLPHTNMAFVSDVDNIKSVSKINNLMFVPMTREDGTSNGVIQLFNFPRTIQSLDKKKLASISRFFGQCLENIEDITKKLTTTLAIQLEAGEGVPDTLKLSDVILADKLTNWEDVKKPFENMNLHVEGTEGVTKETMN